MGLKARGTKTGESLWSWVHWPSRVSTPPQGRKGGARLTRCVSGENPAREIQSSPPEDCWGWEERQVFPLSKAALVGGPQDHPQPCRWGCLLLGASILTPTSKRGCFSDKASPLPAKHQCSLYLLNFWFSFQWLLGWAQQWTRLPSGGRRAGPLSNSATWPQVNTSTSVQQRSWRCKTCSEGLDDHGSFWMSLPFSNHSNCPH